MAITWRDVHAPSNTAVSNMFTAAQTSLDSGFNTLQNTLTKRLDEQQEGLKLAKESGTQDIRELLASYKTPEEFQAAQQSGALDRVLKDKGYMFDRGAVSDMQQALPGQLRDRVRGERQYADETLSLEQRPIVDQLLSAAARGDRKTVNTLADSYDLLNEGQTLMSAEDALQKNQQGIFAGNRDKRDGAQAGREATLFNQGQEEYKRNEMLREQAEVAERMVQQALAKGIPLEEARGQVFKGLVDSGIDGSVAEGALSKLGSNYDLLVNLTPEQQARVTAEQSAATTESQRELEKLELEKKRIMEENPVDGLFSWGDKDRVTVGEVLEQIEQKVPGTHTLPFGTDDVTEAKGSSLQPLINKQVDTFMKENAGVIKNMPGFEMGPILQEAFTRTGINSEFLSDDKNLDTSKLKDNMNKVFNEWVTYQKRLKPRRIAEDNYLARKAEIENKATARAAAARAAEASSNIRRIQRE